MSRYSDEFHELLRKDVSYDDMRIFDARSLARIADAEAVNKLRMSIYKQQSQAVYNMTLKSGTQDDMEKCKDRGKRVCGAGPDERDFAIEDNIAAMYFNHYGENFEGGPIVDNPEDGWTCPGCHVKYWMSLKGLPDRCERCGWLSPLGRMKKDGVFRR